MNRNRIVWTLATLTLAVAAAVGLRSLFADQGGFGLNDLARFEGRTYGVDLSDELGDQPFWLTWTRGDGQAYVILAADPFAQEQVRELGVALYRYSRVGYAWSALAVVGGNLDLIPIGLFTVNIASIAYLGWVAARKMESWGARSLVMAFIPGVMISAMTDTAEAFGAALAIAAITSTRVPALISAGVLGIVRPDFATALFLRGRIGLGLVAATVGSAIGIRLFGLALGLEYSGLNGNLTLPFAGYADVWASQRWEYRTITIGLVFASLVTLTRGMRQETGWARLAPISTGMFVLMLAGVVLENSANSLRAAVALSLVWAVPPSQPPEEPGGSDTLAA